MALWGNKDQANNSPIFGSALVNKTPDESNRDALFENATPDAYIVGETVGVYGNQVTEAGPSGWVLKRTGSGGRAGRVMTEVLVAMSTIVPAGGGGGGTTYWYSLYGDLEINTNDDFGSSITYDNNGNIYVVGSEGNSQLINFLLKYDPQGNLLWQKTFTEEGGFYGCPNSVRVDSLGNIYIGMDDLNNPGLCVIFKLDSNCNILWQKTLTTVTHLSDIALDLNNNLYVCAYNDGVSELYIIKYDSSGNLIWQKSVNGVGTEKALAIETDSENNVYIAGNTNSEGSGNYDLLLIKYSDTGNLLWQRLIGNDQNNYGNGLTVDSNDNIYIVGEAPFIVVKYSKNGSLLWQKTIETLINPPSAYAAATDSEGNLYVSGIYYEDYNNIFVMKFSNSGTLLWQRGIDFTTSSSNEQQWYYWGHRAIAVKGNVLVLTGYYNESGYYGNAITIQLPTDGSLTGTYSNLSYFSTNYISNTSTFTEQAATLTSNTSSLTTGTKSVTVSDNSVNGYTANTIQIGP